MRTGGEDMAFEEEGVLVSLAGQVTEFDADSFEEDFGDQEYAVVLVVDGDEQYLVEPDEEGPALEENVDRWVSVEGELHEAEAANFLVVHSFEIEEDGPSYETDW